MHEAEDAPEQVFGRRVRELRGRLGISQAELGKRVSLNPHVDLDQSKIARLEAGKRPISLGEAIALARVLDSFVDTMVLPNFDLEHETSTARLQVADVSVAYMNIGIELEEAGKRLERLEARLAEQQARDSDG